MGNSIFSKIARREIPAEIIYEDDYCFAFRDIHPQAPTHILVVPRKEIVNLTTVTSEDQVILGALMLAINKIAVQLNLQEAGFRVVQNNGAEAGQSVFHLHFHILSGRPFSWPPG